MRFPTHLYTFGIHLQLASWMEINGVVIQYKMFLPICTCVDPHLALFLFLFLLCSDTFTEIFSRYWYHACNLTLEIVPVPICLVVLPLPIARCKANPTSKTSECCQSFRHIHESNRFKNGQTNQLSVKPVIGVIVTSLNDSSKQRTTATHRL